MRRSGESRRRNGKKVEVSWNRMGKRMSYHPPVSSQLDLRSISHITSVSPRNKEEKAKHAFQVGFCILAIEDEQSGVLTVEITQHGYLERWSKNHPDRVRILENSYRCL